MTEALKEAYEKAKRFIFHRQHAYKTVFKDDSLSAQEVLYDLAKFCRAYETTFHQDPRIHGLIEGRREVWLRIQNNINLDSETLWKLHSASDKKIGANL